MKLLLVLFYSLFVNAQHPPHIHMGKASKKGPSQTEQRTTPLPLLGQSFFNFPTIKIPDFTIPTIPTFTYPFATTSTSTISTSTQFTTASTTSTSTISTSTQFTTASTTSTSTQFTPHTTTTTLTITNSTNNEGIVEEELQLLFLIGVFIGIVLLALFIVFVKNRKKRNIRNNGIFNLNYEENNQNINTNTNTNSNSNSNSNSNNVINNIFDSEYEQPVTRNNEYEYDSYQNQNAIYEEAH